MKALDGAEHSDIFVARSECYLVVPWRLKLFLSAIVYLRMYCQVNLLYLEIWIVYVMKAVEIAEWNISCGIERVEFSFCHGSVGKGVPNCSRAF